MACSYDTSALNSFVRAGCTEKAATREGLTATNDEDQKTALPHGDGGYASC